MRPWTSGEFPSEPLRRSVPLFRLGRWRFRVRQHHQHFRIDLLQARHDARHFGKHFVHVHAKDTRVDVDRIYQHGIMGLGWHTPKLPGLGDVNWSAFFSALTDTGYEGAVCIEVEDRAYEGSLAARQRSLRQSKRYLEQFMS